MDRPRLRTLERLEVDREANGVREPLLVLRDPLGIFEPIAIARDMSAVLDLLNGEKTLAQIRQSLLMTRRLDLSAEDLEEFVEDLSDAGMMEDARFESAWEAEHDRFMDAQFHLPTMINALYPDVPELESMLADALDDPSQRVASGSSVVGLVTPQQPISVAASVLRPTLRGLPPAGELDAIVLLGTDFSLGLTPYVVTDRSRLTPLGAPPVAGALVVELERRLDWVMREEIRHRNAPSLELATVLLMACYGDDAPPVLSVLCGQTALTTRDGAALADEFLGTMEVLCDKQKILLWAVGELSHRGPAYGESQMPSPAAVRSVDDSYMEPLLAGRTEQFVSRCMDAEGSRPSGTAALATLTRLLPASARASLCGYELLAAPGPDAGWVGAAGLQFLA